MGCSGPAGQWRPRCPAVTGPDELPSASDQFYRQGSLWPALAEPFWYLIQFIICTNGDNGIITCTTDFGDGFWIVSEKAVMPPILAYQYDVLTRGMPGRVSASWLCGWSRLRSCTGSSQDYDRRECPLSRRCPALVIVHCILTDTRRIQDESL